MADKKNSKKEEVKSLAVSGHPDEKTAKKSKLLLFAGIGSVLLLALGIGSFFLLKTLGSHNQAEPVQEAQKENEKASPGSEKNAPPKKEESEKKTKDDKKHSDKKEDDKNHSDKKEEGKKGDTKNIPLVVSDTIAIPRMDLNVGNPIENRYLRIALAIEYRGGEEQGAELKKQEAQIKDIIITTVTNKNRMELLSENGKESLRREILNRVNEVAARPIQNIFFTEFLLE